MQLFLNFLSIARVILTPLSDGLRTREVTPGIPWDIICSQLNQIVIVSIWVLLPILCARSFLLQLKAKQSDQEFRTLFYDSFFSSESRILKSPFPMLILICIPLSVWYICTIVHYIYNTWTVNFAVIVHPLQSYPALFLLLQSIFQGCYLLWVAALPYFAQQLRRRATFQSDIQDYINTNLVLLIHCICMTVIVTLDENPDNNFQHLAFGEILYRIVALIFLASVMKNTEDSHQLQPIESVTSASLETNENSACSRAMIVQCFIPSLNSDRTTYTRNIDCTTLGAAAYTVLITAHDSSSSSTFTFPTAQPVSTKYDEECDVAPVMTYRVPEQCSGKNTNYPKPHEIC